MGLANTLTYLVNHPLNRTRKTQAFIGFMKWHFGSRIVPGQVLYDWVNGSKMAVRPGDHGLTGNIYCGLQEFEDMSYLLHLTTPAAVLLHLTTPAAVLGIACNSGTQQDLSRAHTQTGHAAHAEMAAQSQLYGRRSCGGRG